MKSLLSIIILSLICINAFSQTPLNMVPNGSFEDTTGCPTSRSLIQNATGWYSYCPSVDYVNSCASGSSNVGVPQNFAGYQHAAHGNAYAIYGNGYSTNIRECLGRSIHPLTIGTTYNVSISVCLTEWSGIATDDIGVLFYINGDTTVNIYTPGSKTPQVDYSTKYNVLTDTQNWVRLTLPFTADSAYDHIAIGTFKTFANSNITYTGFGIGYYSFIAVDSVVVSVASGPTFTMDTLLCAGDSVDVAVETSYYLATGNSYILQLSDASGSFTNPTTLVSKSSVKTQDTISFVLPKSISPGSGYKTRLIVTHPKDTSDINQNIYIANIDSSTIAVSSNSPVCPGTNLSLSASTNVSNTTYQWSGPNSFSSNLQNPTIVNVSSVHGGNYYSTIKFAGCIVKDTLAVTVKPSPAKPTVTNNGPLCANDTLKLTSVSTTSGVTYSWAGPGSFTSGSADTIIANAQTGISGTYTATAHLNGCNKSDSTTVLIKPNPTATTLTSNTPLCTGDTLKLLSSTSTNGTTYTWSGPNSFTSTTRNSLVPNVSTSASGWYKLSLGLNGCIITDSIQATVYPIPATPTINFQPPICVGDTLKISANNLSGATYYWKGPGNFTSSQQNVIKTNSSLSDTGLYKLHVTVNGCASSKDSLRVNINPQPFVVIYANKDSICNGQPVSFTALPNNHSGTPTYLWFVNSQFAGTGISFTTSSLNHNDLVHCEMTEYTKCAHDFKDLSNDIRTTVLPWLTPGVSITANPNTPLKPSQYVTFTATPTNGGNNPGYQWKRNGSNILGAQSNIWSANTLNDNDSISVVLTSNYMCPQPATANSNGIVVKVLTSVNDNMNVQNLILYPNPNNGTFTLSGNVDTDETLQLRITNALGQVVHTDTLQPANGQVHKVFNIQGISAGIYSLTIKGDKESAVFQISVRQ